MRIPICLATLLILSAVVEAQPNRVSAPPEQRTIAVSGSADIKVKPDYVIITLGVETKHPVLENAKRENDARIQRVLAFLKESALGPTQIQTDFLSIEPVYESHDSTRLTHFTVRKSIVVTLKEPNQFESIVGGVVSRGVTNVHGVDFRTSELKKHREQARILALRAALEKAQKLGAELGAQPGKVLSLSENTWGGWSSWSPGGHWGSRSSGGQRSQVSSSAVSQSDDSPTTLALGEIVVSATVNVTLELK